MNDDRKVWTEPELKQQATGATDASSGKGSDVISSQMPPSFGN